MKIALIGTRGVPASYGGFETAVEQIGQRLVCRGHEVTVYCRTPHITYEPDRYLGMRLVKLPTVQNKYLDTLLHTFISSVHACFQGYDVVLMFIAGNSPVAWIPRAAGIPVALNVDGLDWKRKKWNRFARLYIRLAERMATRFANRVITDSHVVQDYYLSAYNARTVFIPYGSDLMAREPGETLERLGLEPGRYLLFVGRLVPENNAHDVLEAFAGLTNRAGFKLVIVGDAPYVDDYLAGVRRQAAACEDVITTGYLFGEGYRELASNAYLGIVATEVGGTHPVLLEFMNFGKCVVVNDIAANLEVVGDAAVAYDGRGRARALQQVLQQLMVEPELVECYGRRARERAGMNYRWDAITDQYENLCSALVESSSPLEPADPLLDKPLPSRQGND